MNMSTVVMDADFISDLKGELHRARQKFPSNNLLFAALVEEVGELSKAMLEWRAGDTTEQEIWNEAVQVAAMAMRVAVEGDASFTSMPYIKMEDTP
jgi:NTP pyrophosphatase (non-canonical NTP hydrolase)